MNTFHLAGAALATVAALAAQQQFQADSSRSMSYVDLGPSQDVHDMVCADFDGDGVLDLVDVTTVGMKLFRRAGTSWQATDISQAMVQASGLQAADVDADGLPDLVVTPRSGAAGSLLLHHNVGGGAFAPFASSIVAPIVGAVLGDIDGDGDLDLVAGDASATASQGIRIDRWNGTAFQPDLQPGLLGTASQHVPLLGDFDGDGDLDIVGLKAGAPPMLLRNQGGLFTDVSASVSGFTMAFVGGRVVDLDGDGFDDVVGAGSRLDVLWGGPNGFSSMTTLLPNDCRIAATGDIDGNGLVDIAAGRATSVVLMRNQGGRQFVQAPQRDDQVGLDAIAVGDLDGNGVADVVCAHSGLSGPVVRLLSGGAVITEDLATTRGVVSRRTSPPVSLRLFGDVDGDGRTDCVVTTSSSIDLHRALGQGRYARTTQTIVWPMFVRRQWLVDFDGDGDLDIVRRGSGMVQWLANDGTGRFTSQSTLQLSILDNADSDRIGDVDNDGIADVVAIVNGGLMVVRQVGGALVATQIPATFTTAPTCLDLADLDLDGDLDIVTNGLVGSAIAMLRGTGGGAFVVDPTWSLPVPAGVAGFASGDADGDGLPDLVARTSGETQQVRVWLGNAAGQFVDVTSTRLPVITPTLNVPFGLLSERAILFKDLDGDGRDDIFALLMVGELQEVLLQNNGAQFLDVTGNRVQRPTTSGMGLEIMTVDTDDDGDRDLVVSGPTVGRILLNHTRQLASRVPPRLGATLDLPLFSGPGYSPTGLGAWLVSTGAAARPFAVPGLAGRVDLDLANAVVLGFSGLSTVGVATKFVPLPTSPRLVGAELVFQGAILSNGPQPSGMTNAIREGLMW